MKADERDKHTTLLHNGILFPSAVFLPKLEVEGQGGSEINKQAHQLTTQVYLLLFVSS